ncbi:hypothetical protein N7466_007677 [Penicillium verhagenii]|uniref:uncharacterized protein n=1 Tax=Penicillium verhagenii TaxID=1562060 RepID=UPI0025451104|nr:uncharacterized protein N7466_007677 [Penicillium verhagenii]KAJ5928721.1 hypothetical protein N7466_007677 [Penicillium verhagenii]
MSEPKRKLPPPSRRRDKPQLSCNMCRRRKLRCDRSHPCGACRERGLPLSCTYPASAGATGRISKDQPPPRSTLPQRIEQLEKLIAAIVDDANKKNNPEQVESQDPLGDDEDKATSEAEGDTQSEASEAVGHISMQDSKTTYVQDTHWTAILDGITELKDSVQNEVSALANQSDWTQSSSEVVFPQCEPTTHGEILEGLPPRETCDRLVADYLNYTSLPCMTYHSEQYDRFWENPASAHIMWVGKFYGAMSLALMFQTDGVENRNELITRFDQKVHQCLVLGRYQDCPPDTIETICFTLSTQFNQIGDGEVNSLIILGILTRLAQRMGYHRDASHFPDITPYQGEMRRRVWATVTNLDVMLSLSVGLPRLLREFQSDTAPPRNLLDSDFDEDTTELPPSRPITYSTPCQWLVAKTKLTTMLGIITDFSTSIRRPNYAEVMRLDKLLLDTYLENPEFLLERPLNQSLMDTPETILHRIQLVTLLAKARCVLHYRYLAASRSDERYSYSRSTCIGAALKILQYHRVMHQESQPGGRLFREKWKVNSPIMRGVMLLGTTLLCLELNYDVSNTPKSNPRSRPLTEPVRNAIIHALQTSYAIWSEAGESYPKSANTTQAIYVIFQKLDEQQNDTQSNDVPNPGSLGVEPVPKPAAEPIPDLAPESPKDPFTGEMPLTWPDLECAVFLDQAINFPLLQPNSMDSPDSPAPPALPTHIAPELLTLVGNNMLFLGKQFLTTSQTNSVDEMLGISLNFPRMTDYL